MKFSPLKISIFYFIFGSFLVYIAIRSVTQVGWNWLTFVIIGFATFDYYLAIRYFQIQRMFKQMKKPKDQDKQDDE